MKKIRQHNDIDISVVIKNTEGEILDPSLCKGIQIRVQTNGNETQIAHYDIFEDGHIVFRFNAKDQTQIGVYDIVISATTTDGRVFTTDVCKAFCIVPCTCCTDNEPGEVETETLEVEATIEITSWGYMYDKRVEDIEDKLERLDNRDDKLQEQIDSNHTELGEAFEGLYDDVEKNYSKKSNTLRHLTLSSSATANGLSLLLEGEYDDSVQGSHILGPHNIILPYATESKAGVMSPEDKNIITANTTDLNNIKKGTLVVSKTYSDQNGNNIYHTYATKSSVNNISSDILTLQSKIVPVTVEADGLMPKSMLGTDVATKELGNYVEIKHNFNESYLLIPKATSEIAGVMSPEDKKIVDSIPDRDAQLSEQIQLVESDIKTIISDTIDDVEKDYSKKSNTLRHLTLSSSATANGMSLSLEGEYDDSVQGSHILGPHNIILPYATESKAGMMTSEDKKAILENKNTIETLGLITAQGFQGVDELIAKVKQDTNTAIAEVNNRIDTGIEKLSLDVSALFESGGTMILPFTDFANFSKINLYAGTAPVLYIPDRSNIDHFVLERSIIIYYGSGMTAERACASVFRTGSTTVKTSEIRNKNYELP